MAEEIPFKEKIKTIGVSRRKGSSERKPVTNELTGEVGGYHVEHWDDSQDAVVVVNPVRAKSKTQGV